MTGPDLLIRTLAPADLAAMRGMLAMFGEAFAEPEAYAPGPSDDYLADLLGDRGFIAIAALLGGEVVGGPAAYVLRKFEQERSEIYIYDLAIAEAHRRRGMATALIAEVQRIATERGAWVIFVQTDYVDPPAVALYEKLGRREQVLHFDIDPAPR